ARLPLYRELEKRYEAIDTESYNEYLKYPDLEYPESLDRDLLEKFRVLDRAEGELKQAQFLGEIEAFHVMHEAFLALTSLSPSLCFAENESGTDKMYEAYLEFETERQQGIFAQSIVWSYLDYHKPKPGFLFDTKAEKIDYEFPSLEGERASLLPFNPRFRAKIEKLGIRVREKPNRAPSPSRV
nr:hypothetical protein [Pseudobdellovibrionaceae bacterium]